MELCAAGDLSAYIRRHRRLPESTCKFFLRQLAIALRYMRTHNVSHFDLKPSNLLLTHTPALTLRVADFGFAQHIGADDTNTTMKGSPLYMAPEILLLRRYDPRADLWSIGCILYECLTGAAPYRSKSLDELVHKVKSRQRIEMPPTAVASPVCEDLLTRLLVHEPAGRIRFEEFFAHDFIDIDHEPSDANFGRAVELMTHAIELDKAGDYAAAYTAYCDGLQFFVPLIAAETTPAKRAQLRHNADSYLRRAEELRAAMRCAEAAAAAATTTAPSRPGNNGTDALAAAQPQPAQLRPSQRWSQLREACQCAKLAHGLDVGREAEVHMFERNFAAAMEAYRRALEVLVPAVGAEPKGDRREKLHWQVHEWMSEAERVKGMLAVVEEQNGAADSAADGVATSTNGDLPAEAATAKWNATSSCCVQ